MDPSKKRKADENGTSSRLLPSATATSSTPPSALPPTATPPSASSSSAASGGRPPPRSSGASSLPLENSKEAIVITDKATGKSKGYGFVTFRHIDGAVVALKEPSKKIDGRMTVTQLASAGISSGSGGGGGGGSVDVSLRKIYVGNVPYEISSDRQGRQRVSLFFVYKTEEGARASLVDPMKTIDGHQVMCKLAVDGKKAKPGVPNSGGPQGPTGDVGPAPGSMNTGYGVAGGYGGYGVPHQNPQLNQGYGNQGPASFGSGGGGYGVGLGSGGGGYGGSQYGSGSGSGEYGGMNNVGSSMYNRLPPSSVGMPSGGYPESGNYGLTSSAFPTQLHQPSSGPRVPPGGMYQGMPHYY
ncbi:RNA-binding (RRM/RBD/RNP motifs) family protein [Actinidia rufa]|uniref:RNA-binding (RRM/RBD/RNP motifs) family protein n=1 Tax=Actinidia rufa TaxID=165716 RepID=A0A7J0ERL3_9ERIC|nr:RNA-binding (RRM/RBD/RNP motifs) family protein [Actinidia rufa]